MSKLQKVTFSVDYLLEKLILMIREQVEMSRPVCLRVPPPSDIKKPMPDLFGLPSCDYFSMKKEKDTKEMEKLRN